MLRLFASICWVSACFAAAFAPSAPSLFATEPPVKAAAAAAIVAQPSLEEELLALVNQDRTRKGILPLEADEALVRVAREQSRRMAEAGVVSHELPDSGALKVRLDGAGYRYRSARENLARAGTVLDAQDVLLQSPTHARNMFATDVTHVGIGVVRSPSSRHETIYVTQIFADPAARPSPEAIREMFLAGVDGARKQRGLVALAVDPAFGKAALDSLMNFDNSTDRGAFEQLMADAVHNLRAQPGRHQIRSRVAADIQLVRDVREVRIPAHLLDGDAMAFGAGVFEARDSGSEPVVVLLSLVRLK